MKDNFTVQVQLLSQGDMRMGAFTYKHTGAEQFDILLYSL